MYEQYFAFQRPPFSIAPDPSFLYPSPQHRDGLEQLLYGLKKEGGFIVLTGEVGTGKTTLCRLFTKELPPNVHVATVLNAKLNADDLLSNIGKELGAGCDLQASQFQKIEAITAILQRNHNASKKTLLIIEEAQNLNPDALETLRLLTNIETDTTKLLHILLIGQPELAATLGRPDLRQLAQRIVARFHLQPLSREQTLNYVTHRLSVAGGQSNVFKNSAITALYETAGGIPRLINLIADRTLLTVFNEKSKHATAKQVRAAAAIITGNGIDNPAANTTAPLPLRAIVISTASVLVVALTLWLLFTSVPHDSAAKPAPVLTTEAKPLSQPTPASAAVLPQVATAELAVATPAANIDVNTELLKRWQLNTTTVGNLCSYAELNGLLCLKLEHLTLKDVRSYNRPALATVFGENGTAETTLIQALTPNSIELLNSSGSYTLSHENFTLRWRGDLTLVWQPAPGYIDSLYVGDKSFQTVYWLQETLNTLGLVSGKVITGGIYTPLLSEHVTTIQTKAKITADGILGKKTIMAINTELGQAPTLF